MVPLNTSSSQGVLDTYGQHLHYQKNDAMYILGVLSGTFRTVASPEMLDMLTGMNPCAINLYNVPHLTHHAAELHNTVQVANGLDPRPSTVWQQVLFIRLDDPVTLKAILLQFVRYPQLRADSVHLCYFMQSTATVPFPTIVSWEHLRLACKGLEDFLQMFLNWTNVTREFCDLIADGVFEDYNPQYILAEVYTVLCSLGVMPLDAARARPVVRLSSDFYMQSLVVGFAQIRVRVSWEKTGPSGAQPGQQRETRWEVAPPPARYSRRRIPSERRESRALLTQPARFACETSATTTRC